MNFNSLIFYQGDFKETSIFVALHFNHANVVGMSKLPPIELLRLSHSFPGPYTFKIIAESNPTLVDNLIRDLTGLLNWQAPPKHSSRQTESGKHTAITLELVMRTPEEVHTVYHHLETVPGVVLIL